MNKGTRGFGVALAATAGDAHGNAASGAFRGCRNGTEDVSRLITAMVSGPANPVETTLVVAMGADWCYDYPNCPAP